MSSVGPNYYYIDPAKTATQSISAALHMYYEGCLTDAVINGYQPASDSFVFASIRDPYTRVVSLWWSVCSPSRGDYYGWAEYCPDVLSMVRWIQCKAWKDPNHPPIKKDPEGRNVTRTMAEWICDAKVDMFLRFESLDEDFRKLPFYTGVPEKLPVINRKPNTDDRGSIESYLTPEVIEAINEWCCDDFEQFGYEMRRL